MKTRVIFCISKLQLENAKVQIAIYSSTYVFAFSLPKVNNISTLYYVIGMITFIVTCRMLICVVKRKNNKPNISAHGARRLRTKGWVDHKGFPFWSWCWPTSDRLQNRYLIIGRMEKKKNYLWHWSLERLDQHRVSIIPSSRENCALCGFFELLILLPKIWNLKSSSLEDIHKITLRKWNPFKHTLMINR